MRAVVQRVSKAWVLVKGDEVARIGRGLLVYLGVAKGDGHGDAQYIAEKVCHLRCFEDEAGRLNHSVLEVNGQVLLVSNFTICGDCRKGRRPSFDLAAGSQEAGPLFDQAAGLLRQAGIDVKTGLFGRHMEIGSVNDGPVNLLLDSRRAF